MTSRSTDLATSVNARARAAAISAALRKSARKARVPVSFVTGGGGFRARKGEKALFHAFVVSIVMFILLPIASATLYYGFIASDQYVTETRFAVRNGEVSPLDALGSLTGFPQVGRFQDAQIVVNYIHGRSIVERLDRALDLRSVYSRPDVDYLSRFDASDPIEYLVKYWKQRVDVSIESLSGIITVKVRAFTREDSYRITGKIVEYSEQLVNELAERSRRDALRQGESELARAEQRLRNMTTSLRDFRNEKGILDVEYAAQSIIKILSILKLELARLEGDFQVRRQGISPDAPQMRVLTAQIASLKSTIADYEGKMTGRGIEQSLANVLPDYDKQKLLLDIAQKQYVAAAAAYENARTEIDTQRLYISTFVWPSLAEKALYPRRILGWLIIVLPSLLIWALLVGLVMLIRDHKAG